MDDNTARSSSWGGAWHRLNQLEGAANSIDCRGWIRAGVSLTRSPPEVGTVDIFAAEGEAPKMALSVGELQARYPGLRAAETELEV